MHNYMHVAGNLLSQSFDEEDSGVGLGLALLGLSIQVTRAKPCGNLNA